MLKKHHKFLLLIPALLIVFFAFQTDVPAQQKGKIVSGSYDSLLIGVNAQGELTGYFNEGTGDDGTGKPHFTCVFFIYGKTGDEGNYKIKTWHPEYPDEVIEGDLKYVENKGRKGVNLHLNGEHGGCWNVAPELKKDGGVDYDLTTAGNWESIRMISPPKAYFYISAEAKAPQKIYVVKNDAVRILQTKGDRADAVFVNENGKATKGWMKTKDFYALAP